MVGVKLNKDNTVIAMSPEVARHLLKLGYKLLDIRPKRENRNETVFVFANEGNIKIDMKKITIELFS